MKVNYPPRIIKEKHISLKLASSINGGRPLKAMGWRMAERAEQAQLLAGDELDIAFTLTHNDHPDFGGLELVLRDFRKSKIEDALPTSIPA